MKNLILLLIATLALTACKTTHNETVGRADHVQVASLIQEHGYFTLTARAADGTIKWQETDVPNALANEGE